MFLIFCMAATAPGFLSPETPTLVPGGIPVNATVTVRPFPVGDFLPRGTFEPVISAVNFLYVNQYR